jgi:hypothetical protein
MPNAAFQEKHGVYKFDNGFTYTQSFDAYVYNSAYSVENDIRQYFPEPKDIDESYGSRIIRYSDKSGLSDLEDGWRIFRPNNYQSVDSNFGPIKSIHRYNQNILFFQEGAFGNCMVDERVIQQDVNQISVILGEGSVLGKPVYASNINGSIHGNSVITTNNSLMFYDNIANGIMLYQSSRTQGQSSVELSMVAGIHKTMKTRFNKRMNSMNKLLNYADPNYTSPLGYKPAFKEHVGVSAILNKDNIYFSFFDVDTVQDTPVSVPYDVAEHDTVGYNTTIKKFVSFYDFASPIYETLYNDILAVEPKDLGSVWIFNDKAIKSSYYDTLHDSSITFLVSGNNRLDKLYTNITFTTDVTRDGIDLRTETFKDLRIWNEHQDTGVFSLEYNKNLIRRMRRWNVTIPRALPKDGADRKDVRIRSKYIYSKFTFDNNNDKKMILNNIVFKYLISREEYSSLKQR